jgi:DNA-3-methyladenine glycosylase I
MSVPPKGLVRGDDAVVRCWWCGEHEDYRAYHDREWGRPVREEHRLFEKICLEGFQSGLSWLTILRKRERFREVFHDFDYARVAEMGEKDVERLLQDAGIIRHRKKIESTIHNAKRACALVEEKGSLVDYFWSFEPPESELPARHDHATLITMGSTPASIRLSKDLKKRGWTFVGPTTVYAFMQAMGLVNDHLEGCAFRDEVEALRRARL